MAIPYVFEFPSMGIFLVAPYGDLPAVQPDFNQGKRRARRRGGFSKVWRKTAISHVAVAFMLVDVAPMPTAGGAVYFFSRA